MCRKTHTVRPPGTAVRPPGKQKASKTARESMEMLEIRPEMFPKHQTLPLVDNAWIKPKLGKMRLRASQIDKEHSKLLQMRYWWSEFAHSFVKVLPSRLYRCIDKWQSIDQFGQFSQKISPHEQSHKHYPFKPKWPKSCKDRTRSHILSKRSL
jgi:hypothetical protein